MINANTNSIPDIGVAHPQRQIQPGKRAALGLLAIGAMLLTACDAKANDELLASELTYREQKDGWTRSFSIDPWLVSQPELIRRIRAWRQTTMLTEDMECSTRDGMDCYENATFEIEYEGERLVSVLETTNVFSGGAHGSTPLHDHLFDLLEGTDIGFGEVFTSWAKARPLMQSEFCQQLTSRDSNYECADIEDQAITLRSEPGTKVFAFAVNTQDYALGTYADGQTSVWIEITPALYKLIKPEYRADFETPPAY